MSRTGKGLNNTEAPDKCPVCRREYDQRRIHGDSRDTAMDYAWDDICSSYDGYTYFHGDDDSGGSGRTKASI